MKYSKLKKITIRDNHSASYQRRYAIGCEIGLLAIVYADHEHEALDIAVDNNLLECLVMSEAEIVEHILDNSDTVLCDDLLRAGNDNKALHSGYLYIRDITKEHKVISIR